MDAFASKLYIDHKKVELRSVPKMTALVNLLIARTTRVYFLTDFNNAMATSIRKKAGFSTRESLQGLSE